MTEETVAALQGQPENVSADVQQQTPEVAENTEGQVQVQPEGSSEPAKEKTQSQLRRERREAAARQHEQEAQEAKARVAELEKRLDRIEKSQGTAPTEKEYPDPIELTAARTAWEISQRAAQSQKEDITAERDVFSTRAAEQERRFREEKVAAYVDAIEEARPHYADLDQALAVAQRPDVVAPHLAEMVLDSQQSVDIAYHLGKNPALARQLSMLPPIAAARELGRLEASLSKPRAITQTNAPTPINPVRGVSAGTKDPESMSFSEYVAWRNSGGTI